ncbi:MAG: sugar phosphate isomerase/epimerase family protein [Pseudomonadota bacterium]|nr:sugar phosphate isomerase/epimerase family protein [Pseudomonadota bacterium]
MERIAELSVTGRVQVHLPFHFLYGRYLPKVLEYRLNPELSFNFHTLDIFREKDYLRMAAPLREAGLRVTFHAPFMDLRPGALDPWIRDASRRRIEQAIQVATYFQPAAIVCHPSFDDRYYVSSEDQWLENSVQTWRQLLAAAPVRLVLENVYERGPRQLRRLLAALDTPQCGFCFDTGHFQVFSQAPLADWLETLHPYLRHVHLHDNNGDVDAHLPMGEGKFPFADLFEFLEKKGCRPIFAIEAHNERNLLRSLENLERMAFLGGDAPC